MPASSENSRGSSSREPADLASVPRPRRAIGSRCAFVRMRLMPNTKYRSGPATGTVRETTIQPSAARGSRFHSRAWPAEVTEAATAANTTPQRRSS